jgi:hypothetical protein
MQDARSSRPRRFPWIDWTGILLLLAVALASSVLPALGSGPARTPSDSRLSSGICHQALPLAHLQ